MKKSFIRGIWGDITKSGIRDGKMRKDIDAIKKNQYNEPFIVYVFGDDNANLLKKDGFEVVIINSCPIKYDIKKQLYRHKLDIIEYALRDFDEVVFLDWDCVPTASLPDDFWERMGKRAPFQANLFQYRTKKCLWRNRDWRKVCNGGFLYIRGRQIALDFIDNYNEFEKWVNKQRTDRESQGKKLRFREEALIFDDEPAFSKWVDDYMGGWKGAEKYWESFEPEFCNLRKKSAFSLEMLKTKQECFVHWG